MRHALSLFALATFSLSAQVVNPYSIGSRLSPSGATGQTGATGATGSLGSAIARPSNFTLDCTSDNNATEVVTGAAVTVTVPACSANNVTFKVIASLSGTVAFSASGSTFNGGGTLTALPTCTAANACAAYIFTQDPATASNWIVNTSLGATGPAGATGATGVTGPTGSSNTPVNGIYWPFGGVSLSASQALGATNETRFVEVWIPGPGMIVNNVTVFTFSGAADVGHYAAAWYDSTCTRIGATSNTITGTSTQESKNWTFSSITLAAGPNYFGWSSDNTGTKFMIGATDPSGYYGYLANVNEGASTYRVFKGSASTGTTTITMPSTCGTRTALSSGGQPYVIAAAVH